MADKRVVIVHGWDGNPNDSWKPWIREILEKRNIDVIAPQMPGGEHPKLDEWLQVLKEKVGKSNKKTYFLGHSLGCIAILRFLEQMPQEERVGGAILIAGFLNAIESDIVGFCEPPLDVGKVKNHTNDFIIIGSRDDDAVPFKEVLELQNQLGGEIIIDDGKGHFSEDDGLKELPSLLQAFNKVMNK